MSKSENQSPLLNELELGFRSVIFYLDLLSMDLHQNAKRIKMSKQESFFNNASDYSKKQVRLFLNENKAHNFF